jgi:dihydroorotase-like cyclic amidohydrolase
VGRSLRGRVRQTIVRGRTVFQGTTIVGKPEGKLLRPSRS